MINKGKPIITKEGRHCTKCGKFKLWDEFHIDNRERSTNNHTACCKECYKLFHGKINKKIIVDDSGRTCTRCLIYKPWCEFHIHKSSTIGYQSKCKICTSKTHKATRLKCNFNVSIEWYEDKLKRQNGVCAICKKTCSSGHNLSVDHEHKTNKKRGLLCKKCNLGIENLGNNPEILRRAADYLEKYQ